MSGSRAERLAVATHLEGDGGSPLTSYSSDGQGFEPQAMEGAAVGDNDGDDGSDQEQDDGSDSESSTQGEDDQAEANN